ncbi:GntR family transcriptional regulator [Paenibacillus sacheonensis]|uniref:Substrate-binding domain-containing protein n=1 Tax=Paenibacillus sacheonensis TaxID=742054 RepID=A0A7X4YNN6_9BACL|nr:GntR family transcriptional regulator [Paenibacillus sacheonensis]MBM7565957.1 DNA-binding LacI/PurR family transcriptional regulator [Paenibacillus sacheonensis]NBC68729.1 substrate-binding domain-containing protein [Paenibacillus sacheonensis]
MNGKELREKKEKLVKGPFALYEQMRLKIMELIEERGLRPHDPVPSEGELADMFGVSRRTSKEALLALAKEGIVYRMPRRGTFLAEYGDGHAAPAGLSDRVITMVVPAIDDFVGQIMTAALPAAQALGYELLFRVAGDDHDKEEALLRELSEDRGIRGIILFPGDRRACGNQVLRLHLANYPIVIIDRAFRELDIPNVCHDHYGGAYELTTHLIGAGHSQVGFVSEEMAGVMSREERYQGYIQAHVAADLPVNRSLIYADYGNKEADLEAFIRAASAMTAVFCSNDYVALAVMKAAHRLGIEVPGRLSVAGFTDSRMNGLLPVPLTSVRKPAGDLGRACIDLLIQVIGAPEGTRVPSVKLPTKLILRESVAAPR